VSENIENIVKLYLIQAKISVPFELQSLFVPSLSSCHEKATVALYLGRIRTRKAPYPTTQQRVRRGWELNLDYAIVIVDYAIVVAVKTAL